MSISSLGAGGQSKGIANATKSLSRVCASRSCRGGGVLNPNSITIDNRDLVAGKCLTINAVLTLDNQNGDSSVDTRSSVQTI